jgi:hypothetical protein
LANGTLEAVANPLVATLFPKNRTALPQHPSRELAGRPGARRVWWAGSSARDLMQMSWKVQFGLFLVPTVLYGLLFMGQSFPKSEASAKGLSVGEMLKDVRRSRCRGCLLPARALLPERAAAVRRPSPR